MEDLTADPAPVKPKKPTPPSLGDRAKALLAKGSDLGGKIGVGAAEGAMTGLQYAGQAAALPSEFLGQMLGMPMRAMQTRIGNLPKNPRGALGATMATLSPVALADPATRQELGNEAYAAFHPNDPRIQANAEHVTGVDKLLSRATPAEVQRRQQAIAMLGLAGGPMSQPLTQALSKIPTDKLQDAAVHTGFQIGTDPFTYAAPGFGRLSEMGLSAYDSAVRRALEGMHGENIQSIAKLMSPRGTQVIKHAPTQARSLAGVTDVPERIETLPRQQTAILNTLKNKADTHSRIAEGQDDALIRQNAAALKGAKLPPPILERLKQIYADEHPGQSSHAHTVAGFYQPRGDIHDVLLGKPLKPGESVVDRVKRRMQEGREAIRKLQLRQDLKQHLGITDPDRLNQLTAERPTHGVGPLREMSAIRTQAMLVTGVPHMRNIGVLGYLAMGEKGLARAMQYFVGGVPEDLTKELAQGAETHFGAGEVHALPGPLKGAYRGLRGASSSMLNRWDEAVRAAHLKGLRKEFPDMNPLERLDRVNQDLGAYGQQSNFTQFLKSLGGQFPQWHGYIVPTAVTRAIMRDPGRVRRLLSYEQNLNDAIAPDSPYRMTMGGPVSEYASAATNPFGYATTSSMLGLIPSVVDAADTVRKLKAGSGGARSTAKQAILGAGEWASGLVPFGEQAYDAAVNLYKNPLDPASRAGLNLLGPYMQKRSYFSWLRTHPENAATPAPPSSSSVTEDLTK